MAWFKASIADGQFAVAGATIAMKMIALNLLPLPFLAGGQAILEILRSVTRRPLRWPDQLIAISVVICFAAAFVFVSKTWGLLVR